MIGGPANTTYGENTGVLELSHVYDPKVIRLAAIYAVVLSMIPKMAEIIGSMPSAIVGGVSFILYGMISAIGVRNIVENKVDFTKSRNLIIAAVILVCGLGFSGGLTFHVLPRLLLQRQRPGNIMAAHPHRQGGHDELR